MTDPNTNCPSGWNTTGYSKKTCGRATDGLSTCDSVFFPISDGPYSQVCGRIRAYQWGLPFAFHGSGVYGGGSIDDAYFSGVAVMHGSPRQHIWTFAAGARENYTAAYFYYYFMCPCDNAGYYNPPPFVGEDYFCESGNLHPGHYTLPWNRFHSNDTLWDGKDCHSTSTCYSLHNPPYFTKSLREPTTDDIELRMCFYFPQYSENLAIELVDLYVK